MVWEAIENLIEAKMGLITREICSRFRQMQV